jgi:hypothetical protein
MDASGQFHSPAVLFLWLSGWRGDWVYPRTTFEVVVRIEFPSTRSDSVSTHWCIQACVGMCTTGLICLFIALLLNPFPRQFPTWVSGNPSRMHCYPLSALANWVSFFAGVTAFFVSKACRHLVHCTPWRSEGRESLKRTAINIEAYINYPELKKMLCQMNIQHWNLYETPEECLLHPVQNLLYFHKLPKNVNIKAFKTVI